MISEESQTAEPLTLEKAISVAIGLQQSQRLDQAEQIYRRILELYPNCVEALHFLGLLHQQRGQGDEAIRLIEQAVREAPDYADAYNNLGNIYHMQGQLNKAADCYRQTIKINPKNVAAYNNLGVILKDLEQYDEAIGLFQKAIELMSDNLDFYRNLGNAYRNRGDFAAAADTYRIALDSLEYSPENYENLSHMLYLQGKYDEILPIIQQWLKHDPQNPLALHRLAALNGEHLNKASDEYIVQVFDNFAGSFDHVLKNLDYKAPFLVAETVKQLYGQTGNKMTILDAGCGTGLCGPLLKSVAERLDGVDLSGQMLELAAKRQCYDQLIQQELVSFIASQQARYDLIISADTLVYFGELGPVCQAVSGSLTKGGHFVFTLESSEENTQEGYKLNPHGRFSHSQDYIRRTIESSDLSLVEISPVVLRSEIHQPVKGFLITATL